MKETVAFRLRDYIFTRNTQFYVPSFWNDFFIKRPLCMDKTCEQTFVRSNHHPNSVLWSTRLGFQ